MLRAEHLQWIVGNEFDSNQRLSVTKASCVLITATILPPADMSFYYPNNKEKSKSNLVNVTVFPIVIILFLHKAKAFSTVLCRSVCPLSLSASFFLGHGGH